MFGRVAFALQRRSRDRSEPVAELALEDLDRFGFWLDFDPKVAARYEDDTRRDRVAHLRWAILVGLIFYNMYNLTDVPLMRDVGVFGCALRLLVVTPVSLGLVWLVGVVAAPLRESLVTIGMINAIAVPILLFRLSSDPRALYSFADLPLTLVFGCMMLVLRFPAACAFAVSASLMITVALLTKPGLGPELTFVFVLQMLTASAFVLVGNYKIEAIRRRAFLEALREKLRSGFLEKDRQVLTTLSNTDALTGIGNRRYFDDMFEVKLREGKSVALFMMDVDYFKLFNDAYGHPIGDACLGRIAKAMNDQLRLDQDLLARYGGEEFVAVVTDGTLEAAQDIAERIRAGVEAIALPHACRQDGAVVVTVSVGGVWVEAGWTGSAGDLLASADAALYEAKHLGRNTIRIRAGGGALRPAVGYHHEAA